MPPDTADPLLRALLAAVPADPTATASPHPTSNEYQAEDTMKLMTEARVRSHLLAWGTVTALLTACDAQAQEKKDDKRFRSKVVELTDKAPPDWILKEAKVGAPVVSGRDYTISELPDEVKGGTLLLRTNGDEHKSWLKGGTVAALKDGTVYTLVRWRYLGKDVMDEVAFTKLEREGWKEVEGATGTTFPDGEDWRWKAYKKEIKKGDVVLQLKTLTWGSWAVMFVFK